VSDLHLTHVDLLDCTGRRTHSLVLRADGTVEIRYREGHRALVDPRTRRVLTPGITVPPDLLDAAAGLRPAPA